MISLISLQSADSIIVADALVDWSKRFGLPKMLISDKGAHFKNHLTTTLTKCLVVTHNFTLAYTPWSNGTVEVINREVLKITRALLSEYQLREDRWPEVVPLVQAALSHAPLKSLSGNSAVTAFTGIQPNSSLTTLLDPLTLKPLDVKEILKKQRVFVNTTLKSLEELHKTVLLSSKDSRDRRRKNRNKRAKKVNFSTGNYVLVATEVRKHAGGKLLAKWKGIRQITKVVSPFIFEVKDLLTNKTALVHSARIKFYDSGKSLPKSIINPPMMGMLSKWRPFKVYA